MQLNNAPPKIPAAFAASGVKNNIPLTSSSAPNPYNASYDVGFPNITLQPLPSGGKPPDGKDFNGIFYSITALQNWQSAGGLYTYDAAFSASINGYPKGAIVQKKFSSGFWQSIADNNTNDPDSSGANWIDPVISASITQINDPSFSNDSDSPASTGWVRRAMNSIFNSAGFAVNLSANGYLKLPSFLGGLIFQWGSIVAGDDTYTPITFPIPFTGLLSINATPIYNGSNVSTSTVSAWVGDVSNTGVSIGLGYVNGTPGLFYGAYWWAVGR